LVQFELVKIGVRVGEWRSGGVEEWSGVEWSGGGERVGEGGEERVGRGEGRATLHCIALRVTSVKDKHEAMAMAIHTDCARQVARECVKSKVGSG
jgi:hypothetical protein